MDRPTSTETTALTPIARVLAEGDRMRELLDDPGETRVSEPILPLFLAALRLARGGPLVCVLPDDAQARDAAEGASWFLGEERVGLFASRGVRWGSGLEPPPHLVGERARALEVLAAGGLCASALGAAEGIPPEGSRPEPIVLRGGDEPGVEGLAEHLALAGYERVAQAEERGQFAVRGGIVDVFLDRPRARARRALRRRDRVAARVLALHAADAPRARRGDRLPAAERLAGDLEPMLVDDEAGEAPPVPADLVAPLPPPHLVWQADEVEDVVREELGAGIELGDALRVTQPRRPAPLVRGPAAGRGGPRPRRGRARPPRVRARG